MQRGTSLTGIKPVPSLPAADVHRQIRGRQQRTPAHVVGTFLANHEFTFASRPSREDFA
jgi:hypothetical protein